MRILITGAAGFIGRTLAQSLLSRGKIGGPEGVSEAIDELTLFDVTAVDRPPSAKGVIVRTGDIGNPADVRRVMEKEFDLVFHLAAIVSANAEEDFDLGYQVNMHGMLNLLESCRRFRRPARFVYASSTACYGGDLPAMVPDTWPLTPQTSYGAQKAIGELLLQDYHRKGFVDGRGLRLPTIVVRSGLPNRAASTFASTIIREPVAGRPAVCPVRPDSKMYILSPRRAIESFIHAAELPPEALGVVRTVTLPGLGISIGELVGGLERVAGPQSARLIAWKPDPHIQRIVDGWPANFSAERSRALGFQSDEDVDAIIRNHVSDERR
jgi:nucleoside-diphosphate-sugar epimerase